MTKTHRTIWNHLAPRKWFNKTTSNCPKLILATQSSHRNKEKIHVLTSKCLTLKKKTLLIIINIPMQQKNHQIKMKCQMDLNKKKESGPIGISTILKLLLPKTIISNLIICSFHNRPPKNVKNYVNTQDSWKESLKDVKGSAISS